jgi:hypothetical protein
LCKKQSCALRIHAQNYDVCPISKRIFPRIFIGTCDEDPNENHSRVMKKSKHIDCFNINQAGDKRREIRECFVILFQDMKKRVVEKYVRLEFVTSLSQIPLDMLSYTSEEIDHWVDETINVCNIANSTLLPPKCYLLGMLICMQKKGGYTFGGKCTIPYIKKIHYSLPEFSRFSSDMFTAQDITRGVQAVKQIAEKIMIRAFSIPKAQT